MSDSLNDARPSSDLRARQSHRRVVNFGVLVAARLLGGTLDEQLEVRCECGGATCSQRASVTRREYGEGAGCPQRVVVARGHEPTACGRVVEANDRFAVVDLDDAGGL